MPVMRKYIIKPIREIIEFYPVLTKLPVPDEWKNHIIILVTTNIYRYDFGKLPHVQLNFKDVFHDDDGFINEKHLKILKETISKLDDITLVIVGCDAGLSRSPAVAGAIARCVGDEKEARRILDKYQFLNTDVFDVIVEYVGKKTYI